MYFSCGLGVHADFELLYGGVEPENAGYPAEALLLMGRQLAARLHDRPGDVETLAAVALLGDELRQRRDRALLVEREDERLALDRGLQRRERRRVLGLQLLDHAADHVEGPLVDRAALRPHVDEKARPRVEQGALLDARLELLPLEALQLVLLPRRRTAGRDVRGSSRPAPTAAASHGDS